MQIRFYSIREILTLSLIFFLCPIFSAIAQDKIFGSAIKCGSLIVESVNEVSGIVASIKNPDVLWMHNDSGDNNRLFALNVDEGIMETYYLVGCQARDWEDIAIGPGPKDGVSYLYVGDIGDNNQKHRYKTIYRVPEPSIMTNNSKRQYHLNGSEKISVFYPDGYHDAETLLLDPITRDLFIINKSEVTTIIYRIPFPQSTSLSIRLERLIEIPIKEIVGGDISSDGSEIILKTYLAVFYWKRIMGEKIEETLQRRGIMLPYFPEPHGEAICWKSDGSGYYTLSEKSHKIRPTLFFYPRLKN